MSQRAWFQVDEHMWLYGVEGEKPLAWVYWIGGHVERPDSWHSGARDMGYVRAAHDTLEDAKGFV